MNVDKAIFLSPTAAEEFKKDSKRYVLTDPHYRDEAVVWRKESGELFFESMNIKSLTATQNQLT